TNMLLFGTFIFFAYRARFNPATHKRMMLIGTIALMDAAINGWPFAFIQNSPFWVTELCGYLFLLPLLAFDMSLSIRNPAFSSAEPVSDSSCPPLFGSVTIDAQEGNLVWRTGTEQSR